MKPVAPSFPKPLDRRRFGHMGRAAVAILALIAVAGCEQNTFVPPPPPKVEVAAPRAAGDHALSRNHRQHRADQIGRPGGAGAGLPAVDRLQGRRLRQGGHAAVHHRAGDLQAEARSGEGRGSRRGGHAEAGRGRLQAAGRPGRPPGGVAGDARYVRPPAATTPRPACSRRRPIPGSPKSTTATPRSPRPSTASSARIWSRSANWWEPPRRRRSLRPSWRSTRST